MHRVLHIISIALILTSVVEMGAASWHYGRAQAAEEAKRASEDRFEALSERIFDDDATPAEEAEYEAIETAYNRVDKRTLGDKERAKLQGLISFATALFGLALLSRAMRREPHP
jgi:hypothetical protein